MGNIIKSVGFEKNSNGYHRGAPRSYSQFSVQISQQQIINDVVSAAISGIVTGIVVRLAFGGKHGS